MQGELGSGEMLFQALAVGTGPCTRFMGVRISGTCTASLPM